jgi:hypothetical protein
MLGRRVLRNLTAEMERARDPAGFAALSAICQDDTTASETQTAALRHIAVIMAAKGGIVATALRC